jgi:glycosyltransferase involved in cell wall biosynthesis
MELILVAIAFITCLYLLFTSLETWIGLRQLKNLRHQELLGTDSLPSISIVVSALNEESTIEPALISLLNVNYPNLEVIAIDDRSEDNTYEKMSQLKQHYPQLQVYQIKELPENWFGKNHALNFVAERANGEWLLFTDADVIMKSDLLLKAMSYALQNNLDHITMYEYHTSRDFWLNVSLFGHYLTYTMICKPWRSRYAWSNKACGHGAFNLVNKKAYIACGKHSAIAMECLDDLKLGELIKSHGYKQASVDGRDYLEREWYTSLSDMISGMRKNSAAFRDYKLVPLIFDSIFALLCFILPVTGILFFHGTLFWLSLLNVILLITIGFQVARQFRVNYYYSFFFPVSIFFLLYSLWDSFFNVFINQGVIWRGTLYPINTIRNRNVSALKLKKCANEQYPAVNSKIISFLRQFPW